ncbi:hypothetical protein Xmau_00990 [Xenorhabdus mauleonii]|uniref:Aspartyl protease n=1 Tax=Xenorhabdus mauleonii TaxID=351675 RepID=A0A1I3LYB7_9GAMM|nr:aspartyl protease family protein [Xenorhabdus mauleonii]PHM45340.1 hypothetical protein Xmau_00990 [Xenorhabdus mauleonii]SFI89712.1 Aspartyl protease [Xenorhabdus mauleonii]
MCFLLNKYISKLSFIALSFLAMTNAVAAETVMHMDFQLNKKTSLPIATIDIDGEKQEFMIDTGSMNGFHLSKDFMSKISGLVIEPEKARSTDVTGKVFFNEKFNIPQVSINGMTFKNVSGVSLTPWGASMTISDGKKIKPTVEGNLPEDMVIGLGLFKEKAVLIDYKTQKLSVSDHTQSLGIDTAHGWIELPLNLSKEGIVIKVSQNAKHYNMVLDTAASISFFWKEKLSVDANRLSCQVVHSLLTNKECVASAFKLDGTGDKDLSVNTILMDGEFKQLNFDGLIGYNFIKDHAILIDFPGKKLFIKYHS